MQKYKIFTAKKIMVLFFLLTSLQSCKAIEAAHEAAIDYRYLYEQTEEETRQIIEDRVWERNGNLVNGRGAAQTLTSVQTTKKPLSRSETIDKVKKGVKNEK